MDEIIARPHMLKRVNLSSIRKYIMAKGEATRIEIARQTHISSTTVRSLLTEMLHDGEIESAGYEESSGGRKAEIYRFRLDRFYGAALCIGENEIHCLCVDIRGEIVQAEKRMVIAGDIRTPILGFLDALTAEKDIRAIGLGVPGIVSGGGYLSGCDSQELYKDDIGDMLNKRYGIPVILENDLNATMLGFAACYEKQNASESADMAFLFFETGCVSASFISNGKIVRGSGNFAGELNFAPLSGYGSLADLLAEPMDDARYSVVLANIACWICAVLNPKYIALGGPSFRAACIGPIGDALYALLPDGMAAELLYSPDIWADYHSGLACLTAGRIFDEVQLIKD